MLGTILVTSSYKWRSDKIISEKMRKCTNDWNLGYLRRLSCPPHVKMKYLKKKKVAGIVCVTFVSFIQLSTPFWLGPSTLYITVNSVHDIAPAMCFTLNTCWLSE